MGESLVLVGRVLQEEQFQLGPFSAPRALGIHFLLCFHVHLPSVALQFHSVLSRQRGAFHQ